MTADRPSRWRAVMLAGTMPVLALGLQWVLWPYINPFVWFLFFPAVFLSARIGGLAGGLPATLLATLFVWYFFIPARLSWAIENPNSIWSMGLFLIMGYVFSDAQERLRRANERTEKALEETRAANDKINALYRQTLELDELKSQFFANVSHELRTPLTLILGPVAKCLAEGRIDAATRQSLEVVQRNARFLYRHVADLLDVAKLEAKRMDVRYARLDLAHLVRVMASHFDTVAKDRGIRYRLVAPDELAAQMDGEKVQRILLNLLSNAFKFTPDGGEVALALAVREGRAHLSVGDSGPGVPAELRTAVFERFRQVEGNAARRHGGTGLGLAIVKEFAELHGGSVAIADAPSGGALFEVALPLMAPTGASVAGEATSLDATLGSQALDELRAPGAATGGDAEPVGPAHAPLVLVVEDNPDMNTYLADALKPRYRVACAFDGREGMDKAASLHPDLIVSDVMMPRMSGDQMVEALRRQPALADVPIVMLTAKADDALRLKLLGAGVQDYLNKPFSVDELMARIGRLLDERRRARTALDESEARFSLILRTNPNAMLVADADGRIVQVNVQAEHAFGYAAGTLVGVGVDDLVPDGRRERHRQDRLAYAADPHPRSMGAGRELRARRRDGSEFPVEISLGPVTTQGRPYVVATVVDISARKAAEAEIRRLNADLERRVAERTAELEAANRELDSFAYAVSHDLRAPLRAMSGFSLALQEDYGARLDDEAHDYLNEIGLAARKMGELIDGILTLSRSTRGELRRDEVDVSAIAERVRAELDRGEPGRRVAWAIEPGLRVVGDQRMVAAVLENLLGNAWKYTAHADPAEIRVYGGGRDGGRQICIADNGAGFDMAHADRLFKPFQRLHRQDEFPGLGVGLATVQRIVHRHGGEIRATAAPGRGATFCFTLAASSPVKESP